MGSEGEKAPNPTFPYICLLMCVVFNTLMTLNRQKVTHKSVWNLPKIVLFLVF